MTVHHLGLGLALAAFRVFCEILEVMTSRNRRLSHDRLISTNKTGALYDLFLVHCHAHDHILLSSPRLSLSFVTKAIFHTVQCDRSKQI